MPNLTNFGEAGESHQEIGSAESAAPGSSFIEHSPERNGSKQAQPSPPRTDLGPSPAQLSCTVQPSRVEERGCVTDPASMPQGSRPRVSSSQPNRGSANGPTVPGCEKRVRKSPTHL